MAPVLILANECHDRGDLFIGENALPRYHGQTPLLTEDGYRALQAVQHDADDAIGLRRQDPFRSAKRASVKHCTQKVGERPNRRRNQPVVRSSSIGMVTAVGRNL